MTDFDEMRRAVERARASNQDERQTSVAFLLHLAKYIINLLRG
jgi:hypothetical protein